MTNDVKNILLVRIDRIGDVILSLPMLPLLKRRYPNAAISVLIRPYTRELVERHSCVDEVLMYEHEDNLRSLWSVLREIRKRRFDVAIIPYPRFRPALILFLAGVHVRVGSGYRWYSFLFNQRVFEHRKDAKRHEVEYNLNLLRPLGIDGRSEPEFDFSASSSAQAAINALMTEKSIAPKEDFIILHPGSGGSARDWSAANFSRLGSEVQERLGTKVIVTGGKGEEGLVQKVVAGMSGTPVAVVGALSLPELGELIRRAKVFVSNSTGPMHIAAAVGTPVVAFFPPIIQCSPVRWGPYTRKKKVFVADNKNCRLCMGSPCRSDVCMDQIHADEVCAAIKEFLNEQK
ncbi:MAG TPA: glycosyltransferase family 9 protein [Bacteroidota bacterium]|nr:glycosyltransferase family 9 protein [Bacteroidota bacterium]